MTAQQKSLQFGTTEPGDDVIYMELQLDATGVAAGDIISAYCAFDNAFAATPLVVGTNNQDEDSVGSLAAISARPTPTGVTLYAAAVTTGSGALVGTFQVSATLRGVLA